MDLISLQRQLKFYTDDILQKEMMQPSGMVPSYLVLAEINRRKEMREKKGKMPKSTVKDDVSGGMPFGNTPQPAVPFGIPQLASGGIVRYDFGFTGGDQLAQVYDPAPPGKDRPFSPYELERRRILLEREGKGPGRKITEYDINSALKGINRFLTPKRFRDPEPPEYYPAERPDPWPISPRDAARADTIVSPKRPETDEPGAWRSPEPEAAPAGRPAARPGARPGPGIASLGSDFDGYLKKYADTNDPYADVRRRLAEIEERSRGRKGENLGLSLMDWGAGIAASKSPWLGQAMGESGIAALKGYRAGLKDMREEEMAHLGANAKLVEAKVAFDRGEYDKAFKLYQEANLQKYRQQSLAVMASRSGNKEGAELAKFALDSWKSANDSWQALATKDAGTGLAAMKMRMAAALNRGKPEKDHIKYTDIPDDAVRRQVFEEFGVPHDLPQRLMGLYDRRTPGATTPSKGERTYDYDPATKGLK